MINLKNKPFYLDDQQIESLKQILDSMSIDEKIGQIFCPIGSSFDETELREFINKYHPGAIMYRPNNSKIIKQAHELLQHYSKIPLLLAANLESGGNGICTDGTYYSRQMGVAASNNIDNAYNLGLISGREANAVGCNWSFAPIVDIDMNMLNPITNIRTYGSNKEVILSFARYQIKGLKENRVIPCIKHFPGDGVDMRDQHLLSSVNDLSVKEWDDSYGMIYSNLIDDGVETIMVGHILLPKYIKELNKSIKDEEILPASISKEILQLLLRDKLGFNGLIVTDATAMIGYHASMSRKNALPLSIANGCDMILFNKNIDEDYMFIKEALESGLLTYERLDEAVTRILATKISNGLFNKNNIINDISIVGCLEHQKMAYKCAADAITLVKNKENILPINPKKYKRVRVYNLTDQIDGGFKEEGSSLKLEDYLSEQGFKIDIYNYEQLDFYEIFEGSVEEFKNKYDLIIYIADYDTASNHTVRRIDWIKLMACNAPWFINDIPTIFISLANPYHLLDVPMIKTYINCYSHNDACIKSLVNKLIGKETFSGISPVDAFCGRWDTQR